MDCKEFREALDLYTDGELSAEARASAGLHLSECSACRVAADQMHRLRRAVKEAVGRHEPSAELVEHVRRSPAPRAGQRIAALLAAAAALALLLVAGGTPTGRAVLASGMEQVAFHLDDPQTIEVEGVIVCRECELFMLYGGPAERDREGHHGALKTPSGKIWNFMEGEKSSVLIHDEALIGKRVRVRARSYRRAGCLEVEAYEVLPKT